MLGGDKAIGPTLVLSLQRKSVKPGLTSPARHPSPFSAFQIFEWNLHGRVFKAHIATATRQRGDSWNFYFYLGAFFMKTVVTHCITYQYYTKHRESGPE